MKIRSVHFEVCTSPQATSQLITSITGEGVQVILLFRLLFLNATVRDLKLLAALLFHVGNPQPVHIREDLAQTEQSWTKALQKQCMA